MIGGNGDYFILIGKLDQLGSKTCINHWLMKQQIFIINNYKPLSTKVLKDTAATAIVEKKIM